MRYSRLSKYKIKKIIECFSEDFGGENSEVESQNGEQLLQRVSETDIRAFTARTEEGIR